MKELLVVINMTHAMFIQAMVQQSPSIVAGLFQIGRPFTDGMVAEAVEAGAVDDVKRYFRRFGDAKR